MNQLECNGNGHGACTVKRRTAARRKQKEGGTQALPTRGDEMYSHICYKRGLGDNGFCERRFKFLEIRLYDIKHVVLQRRITYIGLMEEHRLLSSIT